jgi:hypothetical protein
VTTDNNACRRFTLAFCLFVCVEITCAFCFT